MIVKIIEGDLLEAKENVICQQCNCVTAISHGLSKQIAKKYPWADIYSQREQFTRNCTSKPSVPGTVSISENDGKKVIHLFGQYLPGKPGIHKKNYSNLVTEVNDTYTDRERYFKMCLEQLDLLNLDNVAMPYLIGCGLAGGNWAKYNEMLQNCKTSIILYKL